MTAGKYEAESRAFFGGGERKQADFAARTYNFVFFSNRYKQEGLFYALCEELKLEVFSR